MTDILASVLFHQCWLPQLGYKNVLVSTIAVMKGYFQNISTMMLCDIISLFFLHGKTTVVQQFDFDLSSTPSYNRQRISANSSANTHAFRLLTRHALIARE